MTSATETNEQVAAAILNQFQRLGISSVKVEIDNDFPESDSTAIARVYGNFATGFYNPVKLLEKLKAASPEDAQIKAIRDQNLRLWNYICDCEYA